MPSQIATQMLRKKQAGPVEDVHDEGHPHMEPQHDEMDKQHAYDSAMSSLQSLEKSGMPGAKEIHKQLMSAWSSWQGSAPMQPATKISHKASPVGKSEMDQQDENLAGPDEDLSQGE